MKIFVAKLNFNTTSDDLWAIFEQYGEVASATVIFDQETGHSKGMAFVEMPADDEAQSAIDNLNEFDFDGNKISVREAHERENRDNHGYNRGGGSDHGGGGSRGDGRW
jgi:RNA recognition motif-containing protein